MESVNQAFFGLHMFLPDLTSLMHQCAPNVGVVTMSALVRTESSGNPYILADAGPKNLPWAIRKDMVRTLRPATAQEAAALTQQLLDKGHIVAIGLTQINAKNLPALRMTIADALDPCKNLRGGAKILSDFYGRALRKLGAGDPQAALQAALSAYWSGNMIDGFKGGYVQKVIDNAGLAIELKVPSLARGSILRTPGGTYNVGRDGAISPNSAPLAASFGVRPGARPERHPAGDPRRAPLEAPGFGRIATAP